SGTSPGSPEHALDMGRIPESKEKRRDRSVGRAGCPSERPVGPLRLVSRPITRTSRQTIPTLLANSARGTATWAIWNVTAFAWDTTFAPIWISFSRSVVSVQVGPGLARLSPGAI